MKIFLLKLTTIFISLVLTTHLYAYEQAYTKTVVGEIQLMNLPAAKLIEAGREGSYFQQSNKLFRSLFKYIKENEIAMTVPVEGDLGSARMRFYVGEDAPTDIESNESVSVVEFPSRMVSISMGDSWPCCILCWARRVRPSIKPFSTSGAA